MSDRYERFKNYLYRDQQHRLSNCIVDDERGEVTYYFPDGSTASVYFPKEHIRIGYTDSSGIDTGDIAVPSTMTDDWLWFELVAEY